MGKVDHMSPRELAAKYSVEEIEETRRIQHEAAKAELAQAKENLKKTSLNPNAGRPPGRQSQRCSCGKHSASAAARARLACRLDKAAKR